MNPWEDAAEILILVRNGENWLPELFERCRNNTLISPCIHNQIRNILTPEQYQKFDDAYSLYFNPGQKGVIEYLRKLQKEGAAETWKIKEKELLSKKRQILRHRLQTLTGN